MRPTFAPDHETFPHLAALAPPAAQGRRGALARWRRRPQTSVAPAFAEKAPPQLKRGETDPAPEMSTWPRACLALGRRRAAGPAGYIVTERGGALRHVRRDGTVSAPLDGTPEVVAGVRAACSTWRWRPTSPTAGCSTSAFPPPEGDGLSATAAVRAKLSNDLSRIEDVTEIFRQTPPDATPGHYGSRVVPLPDGTIAITTGDRMRHMDRAQDPGTSYGAVVRVTPEGEPATDSPFVDIAVRAPPSFTLRGHRTRS